MDKSEKKYQRTVMRYSHLGIQLALTMGLFTFLGHFLEKKYGFIPWGIVTGAMIGFVIGFYHLLKGAKQMEKELDDNNDNKND